MKRWHALILSIVFILCVIFGLSGSVRNPAKFSGKWFYAADGSAYLFHNGIIISEKHHIQMNDEDIFSGAYSFGKDSIFLFFVSSEGVEEVQELQLISEKSGDKLCKRAEDGMNVIFYRK